MATTDIPQGLRRYLLERLGAEVERAEWLGPDKGGGTTAKVEGYGRPLRLWLRRGGQLEQCVFHLASSNPFGHDRRSDRALEQLLAFDTFGLVPKQVSALDVGALREDGGLVSLSGSEEFFLLSAWAEGEPYANDLRRLAHGGALDALDLERAKTLARFLAGLHQRLGPDPVKWERAIRDTVGSGEGIFGVCDAYGSATPGAPRERLERLESLALLWRWRLKGLSHRRSRTHGDFHPFNLVFREGVDFSALDASRGCEGEPADDVTALAVNYVFFAIEHKARWGEAFGPLWRAFWETYLSTSRDAELLTCVAPFFAWRALVVCCPRFYPHLSAEARDALLGLAERGLKAERFDPEWAEALFQ